VQQHWAKPTSSVLLYPRQVLDNAGLDVRLCRVDDAVYSPRGEAALPPAVAFSADQRTARLHAVDVLASLREPHTQHVVRQKRGVTLVAERTTVLQRHRLRHDLPKHILVSSTYTQADNQHERNCPPWRVLTTPVNTRDRSLPLRNNCFNPTSAGLTMWQMWQMPRASGLRP